MHKLSLSYETEKKILSFTWLNKTFAKCVLFKDQKLTSSSKLIDTYVCFINSVGKKEIE